MLERKYSEQGLKSRMHQVVGDCCYVHQHQLKFFEWQPDKRELCDMGAFIEVSFTDSVKSQIPGPPNIQLLLEQVEVSDESSLS